jgi:hypothetical protein
MYVKCQEECQEPDRYLDKIAAELVCLLDNYFPIYGFYISIFQGCCEDKREKIRVLCIWPLINGSYYYVFIFQSAFWVRKNMPLSVGLNLKAF